MGMAAPTHHTADMYQEQGVATYWVVDPDPPVVEIWVPDVPFPVSGGV